MRTTAIEANHRLLVLGLSAIIITAGLMYGVLPQWRKSTALQGEIEALQRRMAGVDIDAALESEQQHISRLKQQLEPMLLNGSKSLIESQILDRVQQLARSNRLLLQDLNTEHSELQPGLNSVGVNLKALTSYDHALAWFKAIDSDPSIHMTELRLYPTAGSSKQLQIDALLNAYYRPGAADER